MKSLLFLILIAGLILVIPARPQDVSGGLEGFVLDSQGAPLEGTKIILSGPDLQGIRETATDNRGRFLILALPVGAYTVKIQHPAFQDMSLEKVSVRLGRTASLGEIRLRSRAVEEREIVVTAARPLIDESSTAGGSSFDVKTIETLPVNRDYRSLTLLIPNVVEGAHGGEANFSGATGLENRYFIDGIDTTDPFRGVGGTALPYNFIKEIEVRTGGYEAEYRSSLGGIVNVITSSGGNKFAGQVFGFFNNDRFSGESRTGIAEPSTGRFSQYDFGASLGGPIVLDRLWFFAAYNPRFTREEAEIPGQGFFRDQDTTHIFAGKLTWQVSPKTNVVLTALGDPSSRDAVGDTWGSFGTYRQFLNPDPFLERIRRGGVNFSLKGTYIASGNLVVETSISWINRREQNLPATDRGREERAFYDTETGTLSGGSPGWMNDLSKQGTISATGTWIVKDHIWKFGLEYRENTLVNDWTWSAIIRYSNTNYQDFWAHTEGTLRNRIPTVFIQDSWSADRRTKLNWGLRWDGQFLVATDGRVSQRILGQFQPRIGLVYETGRIGSQKVFASYGRFYQELMLYAMTFYGTDVGAWQFMTYDHDPRIDPSGGILSGWPNRIQPEISGLRGQYYDEFTLGYERAIGKITKARIRGIYRRLGQGFEDGAVDLDSQGGWGNPGSGTMDLFPKLKRRYTALEACLEHFSGRHFSYFASYVLSRNKGNFPGLANEDWGGVANPNAGAAFDLLEMAITNEDGLLPNDRTHVLKLSGSYRMDIGLTIGTHIVWESGTPRNEWGGAEAGPPFRLLMQPRGTAGRTPAIFDLNVRFSYDLARLIETSWSPRVFLDIFHFGSSRTPVEYDDVHYLALEDGKQDEHRLNPTYGLVTRYFPPMSARLGFEVGF